MSFLQKLFGSYSPRKAERPNCPDWVPTRTFTLAEPPSQSSDPTWSSSLTKGGYRVKIKKGTKRMTLFRFLLAKAVYEVEGIHLDEFIVLMELYFQLRDSKDPSFKEKYDLVFSETEKFFSKIAGITDFPVKVEVQDSEELRAFLDPLLPSKSAYFGLRGQRNLRLSFKISLNEHLFPQRIRPKSFVGVGYRDKGQRRDLAKDGSPHWTEVASHNSELERRAEENSSETPVPPSPLDEGYG